MSGTAGQDNGRQTRLVVVGHVYHQRFGHDPVSVSESFCHWLESGKASDVQELEIGEQWVGIDCKRVGKASVVFLVNRSVLAQRGVPEDKADGDEPAVLEIAYASSAYDAGMHNRTTEAVEAILPGESRRLHPIDAAEIRLRCRRGVAQVMVHLFPE